jgi:SRSO17 transposase
MAFSAAMNSRIRYTRSGQLGGFLNQEDTSMTAVEVRAAADELVHLHKRFAPLFGRVEARTQSQIYLNGLLLATGRKSAEPMALVFGQSEDETISQNQVLALQRFLTYSPWSAQRVEREIQAVFADKMMPSAAEWPIGTIGVIDESGFVKQGTHSVGVQRQYCGHVGKKENCQMGVFLVGVTPAGSALLDEQLYLPRTWADNAKRRAEAGVPEEIPFQTKPQIATALLQRTRHNALVKFDWVTADEFYGHNGDFLDDLEKAGQRYVVEIPVNTTVWTVDPQTQVPPHVGRGPCPTRPRREHVRAVRALAAEVPVSAWQALQLRVGAKGPLVFEFARVRVWAVRHRKPGPACWLLLRRSLEADAEVKYYLCWTPSDEPLETMALVTGTRYRVEEYLEEGKSYLGMAQYEARAWSSWHHHMSLVALAHLYVTLTRQHLKKKLPGSRWTWPYIC